MKCPACGAENPDGKRFCGDCGYSFSDGGTGKLNPDTILEDRYIIVKTVGQGGMGAVYMALDRRLNHIPVAIKEMSARTIGGGLEAGSAAFKKEASILLGLHHQSLPVVRDFFAKGDDRWYLVMDYIEGQTLWQIVDKRGPIPEAEVLDWANQLCDILDYLHNQSPPIIFRDLKPANIMLTPQGKIKLIDFGIARHFRAGSTSDTTAYGSQGFAPPEQYGQNQTSPASDVYALGATLHYLLTGIDPGKNPFVFDPPGKMVTISTRMDIAIMKALELKAEMRPQSMQEMQELLPVRTVKQNVTKGQIRQESKNTVRTGAKGEIKELSQAETTPISLDQISGKAANVSTSAPNAEKPGIGSSPKPVNAVSTQRGSNSRSVRRPPNQEPGRSIIFLLMGLILIVLGVFILAPKEETTIGFGVLLTIGGIGLVFIYTSNRSVQMGKVLEEAVQYTVENRYREAIKAFSQAIEVRPQNVMAYQGLSRVYALCNDEYNAENTYCQGLAAVDYDDRIVLQLGLGSMFLDTGANEDAVEAFMEIRDYESGCLEAYWGLAMAFQQKGDTAKAEAWLKTAAEIRPQDYRVYNTLAAFYKQNGKIDQTFDNLIKSISLEVNQQEAYRILSDLYIDKWFELNKKTASLSNLEVAAILEFYGCYSRGEYRKALDCFNNKRNRLNNNKAMILAATAMARIGDEDEAEDLIYDVLRAKIDNWLLSDLARYYLETGDRVRAQERSIEALQAHPDNLDAISVLQSIGSSYNTKTYAAEYVLYDWKPTMKTREELMQRSLPVTVKR